MEGGCHTSRSRKKETSVNEIMTAETSPDILARMPEFVRLWKLYLEMIYKTQPKSSDNMIRKTAT